MAEPVSLIAPGQEFELAIDPEKLADIVENKMRPVVFDPQDAYEGLSRANKRALTHLVKAAAALDPVFLKQDHPDTIRAKELLKAEAATGSSLAANALKLFTMHNGLEGVDLYAPGKAKMPLFKNKPLAPGAAFFPQDATQNELVSYVLDHPEQAAAILGNNTIVRRDGHNLVAEPYSVVFREEMQNVARELFAAARETDHAGFASYLRWQAQALVNDSDPVLMFNADKTWAALDDAPLEFTISREDTRDHLSAAVAADPRAAALLKENGICANIKDSLGARVGIVNQESREKIAFYANHVLAFAQHMPLRDQYRDQAEMACNRKVTYVDVDMVAVSGDRAVIRGGAMTIAQNLPNDDKLSVQLSAGNRLVFHRQVAASIDGPEQDQFLNRFLDPRQRHLYSGTDFDFVIGHELLHSHGPMTTKDGRDKKTSLGSSGMIIEENKADMGSIAYMGYLKAEKFIDADQASKIFMSWIVRQLPARAPGPEEAHRMRSVMQLNYLKERGAIVLEEGKRFSIVPEKIASTATQMLTEIIDIQLSGDPAKAQAFVDRHGKWNKDLQYVVDERQKLKPRLYRFLEQPMRDRLLAAAL